MLRPWTDHLEDDDPARGDPVDLVAAGTLVAAWTGRWARAPGAPLWHGDGRWWSAGEFEEATRRAAGRWHGAGLVPGDRVVWSTSSSVASLAAHVGALRAGLVVVPANTAYGERELGHIVADVEAAAAVVERPEQAAWVGSAAPGALVVGPDLDVPEGDPGPLDEARPDDPALICFTSGTTGAPKGAVLRHRNLLASVEGVRRAWRWSDDDRLVHALPVFHAHGLVVGAYGTMAAGASAVLLGGFDVATALEAAAEHRASLFFGVPTMYHRLAASGRAGELGALRLCVSGSAPLPAGLHAEVSAATGRPVLERYGMTETLMNTSTPYAGERRAGTVGFPLPGVEVALDGDGQVLLRGPNVFDGYWRRPAADAAAFVDDPAGGGAWFASGDLGEEVDGMLAIRGRGSELIISGGYNVYPAEVEDVLATHPGIVEVAVTGTPSDEWGEVVTAWVVCDGPAPVVEDLRAHCDGALAPFKQPRLVHRVDALPRNALGKVVRSELGGPGPGSGPVR